MEYTITPEVGVDISGCPDVFYVEVLSLKFGEGDIAFVRKKANRGILERIAVAKVKVRTDLNCGSPFIMYFDTYNGRWMESELVTHAEAIDLATTYLESQIAALESVEYCN